MLVYHVACKGTIVYLLEAICVHGGRAHEITFASSPGSESADLALFQSVLASFGFAPGS
jgi:hypothetical protein